MAKTLRGPYRLEGVPGLPVYVTEKDIKKVYIRQKEDHIAVSKPPEISDSYLLKYFEASSKKSPPTGILFLARTVPIRYAPVDAPILGEELLLPENYKDFPYELLKWHLDKIIKEALTGYIDNRLKFWSQRTGIDYENFKIRTMKTRWGSCTPSTKVMRFNFFLTVASPEEIDSVVLHELAHIKIPNHSKEFYDYLRSFIPDYDVYQNRLEALPTSYLIYGN